MKVALYARVSKADKDKDGNHVQNPENQLMKLRAYAHAQGFEVYKEYQDMKSGADAHRPGLDRMMADARGHRFSLILVGKIDRIARSMRNLHSLLTELETFGIGFHCVDQPEISTDTPMGKLLLNVLGAVAEFERELIRERTKDGLARAVASGSKLGRKPVKIDLEKVHALQSQKWGIRRIAKELGIAPDTLRKGLRMEGGKITREAPPSGG